MSTLIFVCPVTGKEVPTGLEMDPATLLSLRSEEVRCSQCGECHRLSEIRAWIAWPADILSDESLAIA